MIKIQEKLRLESSAKDHFQFFRHYAMLHSRNSRTNDHSTEAQSGFRAFSSQIKDNDSFSDLNLINDDIANISWSMFRLA